MTWKDIKSFVNLLEKLYGCLPQKKNLNRI